MLVFKLKFHYKNIKTFDVNLWKRISEKTSERCFMVVIETNNTKGGAVQYFTLYARFNRLNGANAWLDFDTTSRDDCSTLF